MRPAHFAPVPISMSEDVQWPALANPAGTAALALQYQLDLSQWYSAETLQELQFAQLRQLIEHAWARVPWHRPRLISAGWEPGKPLTPAILARLPLMRRADIQREGKALYADGVPKEHGRILLGQTSGSTGQPMKFLATQLNILFWEAFTLRESLWQQRDFSQKLASIRPGIKSAITPNWGSAFAPYDTGPHVEIPIQLPLDEQLDLLLEQQPAYLLSTPNHLATLAEALRERGLSLPGLHQLRTFGVTVEPRVRTLCREVFGKEIADMYSTTECGYLALQCPDHAHLHVQSEGVLLEVLREDGTACTPGETGRVVVTVLHNFAMPLLRYELGDFAEVGEPCACGRGLPVLNRIVGRVRNQVKLPDGSRAWPSLATLSFPFDLPIRQWQVVQDRIDHLTVRLAVNRKLDAAEIARIRDEMASAFGKVFSVDLEYLTEFQSSPSGKFEDFVSLVN